MFFSARHIACLFAALFFAAVSVVASEKAHAQMHVVVDRDTGEVLSHKRATRRWAPASLTKVMTAYVAFHAVKLQQVKMNSPVGVSAYALSQDPTKMGFPVGTVLTLENAIKLMMVKSANDVSMAIAESVAGSEENFVRLMNAHARRLGMKDTLFQNPNGLPDPLQYTSAADMARMAIATRKDFPEFAYLFSVPAVKVGRRTLRNYNRLLTRFKGADGMKTGFVCASGYNTIVTATRKNRNLVVVVLGERSGRKRNIKAATELATVRPPRATVYSADGKVIQPDIVTLDDLPRVAERHDRTFDLHAPGTIEHLVCKREYREPPTAFSALQRHYEKMVMTAKKERIREETERRLASAAKKEAMEAEKAAANAPGDETSLMAMVDPDTKPQLGSAQAIEGMVAISSIPVPAINPKKTEKIKAKKAAETKSKTRTAKAVKPKSGPSISELEKKYLSDKVEVGPVQIVQLGGAFGPNPWGIPVLNGAADIAKAPVPGKRPELICDVDEAYAEGPIENPKAEGDNETAEGDCLPVPMRRAEGLAQNAASKPAEPVKAAEPSKTAEPVKAAEPSKTAEPAKAPEPAATDGASVPVPAKAPKPGETSVDTL